MSRSAVSLEQWASFALLRAQGQARAGEPWRLTQFVAFAASVHPRDLIDRAMHGANAAAARGFEALHAEHAAAWRRLWRGDIAIEGDAALERQARFDLFQIYQNADLGGYWPFQVSGCASTAYWGGVFWDADAFILPAAVAFGAELGRGTVAFRHRGLDEARRRAAAEGRPGAKYPWEACHGTGEALGLAREHEAFEIHVTAAVAHGAWAWHCANGNVAELRAFVWPILRGCAEYWTSRAEWIPWEGRYEIRLVTGMDETCREVANCLGTNALVRRALRHAVEAARLLGLHPDPMWTQVADGIHLPRNRRTGLWQGHSGLDGSTPRKWVESLAVALGEIPVDDAQMDEILNAEAIHWDMSLQGMVAAQAGDRRRFSAFLLHQATAFPRPDFGFRTEHADNDAGPFLTGCGAFLQSLLFGTTGLRWQPAGLSPVHPPCLPEGIEQVIFSRLEWHGLGRRVEVGSQGLSVQETE